MTGQRHLRLVEPTAPPRPRRIDVRISAADGRAPIGRTRVLRLTERDFERRSRRRHSLRRADDRAFARFDLDQLSLPAGPWGHQRAGASIEAVELLHPIVVTPSNELVCGERRIEAAR